MTSSKSHKSLLILLQQDINISQRLKTPLNKRNKKIGLKQNETDFIEYSLVERFLYRDKENDRVIPIDNLTLNDFNLSTGNNVESAEIHYGPSSDELTRSHHALALTIGSAIYFRSNAYKPENEEGRALLAHELTHVAQNKEDIPEAQRPVHELEKEAAAAEKSAEYNPEKYRELIFKDKTYTVSQRQYKQIMQAVKYNVQYALEHNTLNLQEKEYLKFLAAFTSMEKNGELIWQK